MVDCTLLEEACTDMKVVVAINPKGNICSIVKEGAGALDASLLADMLDIKDIALNIFKGTNVVLAKEDLRFESGIAAVGFL